MGMLRAGTAFDIEHLADEGLLAGRLHSHQITDFDGHKDRLHGNPASNPLDSSRVLVVQGVGLIGLKVASPDQLARVKRIALIAAAASLLAGCQSSQEFCAEYKAGDAKNAQALKKLGLKQERNWFYNPQKLERYCQ